MTSAVEKCIEFFIISDEADLKTQYTKHHYLTWDLAKLKSFQTSNFLYDDNLVPQMLINQGYNAIDLLILTWVDFKSSLLRNKIRRTRKMRKRKKILLFTVTEFNKNLRDRKRLPYCFCFGVENVILVLFLGKNKISCCYKSYAYGKMLFFNTWWLTYFRSINDIVNKHFANLKCEIWIIIKTHLSA